MGYDFERVATLKQDLENEIAILEVENCDCISSEKFTGINTNWPDYFNALNFSIACCSVAK